MVDIPSTPADGNIRTVILSTPPAAAIATTTEIAAGVDISCYLTPGGFALGMDQAGIADPRECSTQDYQKPGRKSFTLSVTGIDNTNSANEASFNDLVDVMVQGSARVAYRRRGVAFDDVAAVGEVWQKIPFDVGQRAEVSSEANSVTKSMWPCFITGEVEDVTLTA